MAYTCDHCELVFSDKTELLLHVETITDEKPYQCADCENFSQILTTLEYIYHHTMTKMIMYQTAAILIMLLQRPIPI